mgnify:CR=1 FL=1
MKKKSIILLIITILLIDNLRPLYLTLWQLNWKAHIRKELKLEVKNNHLLKLTFSKFDLNNKIVNLKFIRNDEFFYNNQMYDIVRTMETKDSISYVCYLDLKEMLQISSMLNIAMNSGLLTPFLPILKNKIIQFFDYLPEIKFNGLAYTVEFMMLLPNNIHTILREIEVNLPPPKLF